MSKNLINVEIVTGRENFRSCSSKVLAVNREGTHIFREAELCRRYSVREKTITQDSVSFANADSQGHPDYGQWITACYKIQEAYPIKIISFCHHINSEWKITKKSCVVIIPRSGAGLKRLLVRTSGSPNSTRSEGNVHVMGRFDIIPLRTVISQRIMDVPRNEHDAFEDAFEESFVLHELSPDITPLRFDEISTVKSSQGNRVFRVKKTKRRIVLRRKK